MIFVPSGELVSPSELGDAIGVLVVSSDELAVLANSIVQARLAIDDWEFSSLVGTEVEDADRMRMVITDALRAHMPPQT